MSARASRSRALVQQTTQQLENISAIGQHTDCAAAASPTSRKSASARNNLASIGEKVSTQPGPGERAVAQWRIASRRLEQVEALLQTSEQGLWRKKFGTRGRELQRQRQAVQVAHELDKDATLLSVNSKNGSVTRRVINSSTAGTCTPPPACAADCRNPQAALNSAPQRGGVARDWLQAL